MIIIFYHILFPKVLYPKIKLSTNSWPYFFRNLIPVNFRDILNQLAGRIPTDDTPFSFLIPVRLSLYGLKSPCFICSSLFFRSDFICSSEMGAKTLLESLSVIAKLYTSCFPTSERSFTAFHMLSYFTICIILLHLYMLLWHTIRFINRIINPVHTVKHHGLSFLNNLTAYIIHAFSKCMLLAAPSSTATRLTPRSFYRPGQTRLNERANMLRPLSIITILHYITLKFFYFPITSSCRTMSN